jgi:hypothetical protein
MINWYSLVANFIWIFALALALASLSYAYWEAAVRKIKFRTTLKQPQWQLLLNLSGALFCLGLAATTDATWETALWLILMALFIFQPLRGYFASKRDM